MRSVVLASVLSISTKGQDRRAQPDEQGLRLLGQVQLVMRAALFTLLVACKSGPSAQIANEQPPQKPGTLAEAEHFRLEAGPPASCAAGSTCEATLVLVALGPFHVNPEYPFKFVGDPTSEIAFDGTGTFAVADPPQRGTMTLSLRPAKPGNVTVTGTFKLSVCSVDECRIEAPKIVFTVAAN